MALPSLTCITYHIILLIPRKTKFMVAKDLLNNIIGCMT
jgi:hypothetical protein